MSAWLQVSLTEILPSLLALIIAGYSLLAYYFLKKRRKEDEITVEHLEKLNSQRHEREKIEQYLLEQNKGSGLDPEIRDRQGDRYQVEVTEEEYYALWSLLNKIESADADDTDRGTEHDE